MTCPKCSCSKVWPIDAINGVKAVRCPVCGFYHEDYTPDIKPLPDPTGDYFKGPGYQALAMCQIEGCEEGYRENLTSVKMCRRHKNILYQWGKSNKTTPAPFAEVDGRWQVNPARIDWERKGRPRFK
jgi:hypothetical protein